MKYVPKKRRMVKMKQWKKTLGIAVSLAGILIVGATFFSVASTSSDGTVEIISMVNDNKHLRLIFDASNLLEFPEHTDQEQLWTTWLGAIGEYVDVLHIKDFSLGRSRIYQPEPLGTGVMRYKAISRWLQKQDRELYLIREEMNLLFAKDDLAFIRGL